MRTSLARIQRHHHAVILRHILNFVNSFLCSSTNYFENQLLPNYLIIVKNHVDDEEDVRDTMDVLESKETCIPRWRSNSIQNFGVRLRVQLRVQDHLAFKLMYMMRMRYDLDVIHIHGKIRRYVFQHHQFHGQLKSESPRIVKTRLISKTFLVLHQLFWADDPCIELETIRDAS
jgi:hypothetical protein